MNYFIDYKIGKGNIMEIKIRSRLKNVLKEIHNYVNENLDNIDSLEVHSGLYNDLYGMIKIETQNQILRDNILLLTYGLKIPKEDILIENDFIDAYNEDLKRLQWNRRCEFIEKHKDKELAGIVFDLQEKVNSLRN
jgi:hypothetical protein